MLEKLKKDYGVKVVATRERPGASLAINCEDQSNQMSGICGKSAQPELVVSNINEPVEQPTREDQNNQNTSEERHQPPNPIEESHRSDAQDHPREEENTETGSTKKFGARNKSPESDTNRNSKQSDDSRTEVGRTKTIQANNNDLRGFEETEARGANGENVDSPVEACQENDAAQQ